MNYEPYPCTCKLCQRFPELEPKEWIGFLQHREGVAIFLDTPEGDPDLFLTGLNGQVLMTCRGSSKAKPPEEMHLNITEFPEYIKCCEVKPRELHETPFISALDEMPSAKPTLPYPVTILPR